MLFEAIQCGRYALLFLQSLVARLQLHIQEVELNSDQAYRRNTRIIKELTSRPSRHLGFGVCNNG